MVARNSDTARHGKADLVSSPRRAIAGMRLHFPARRLVVVFEPHTFTWRNRTAEAIMLGAALYNRQIQLQQLYIKQKTNQFTLSGEAAFPSNSSGWLSPDFRGNISASINQLGDFAALFGANPGDFLGKITIAGAMDTRDRKFGGHLALDGSGAGGGL